MKRRTNITVVMNVCLTRVIVTDAFLSKTMYQEILFVRAFIEEIIEHLVYKSSKYAILHKYSLIMKCAFV